MHMHITYTCFIQFTPLVAFQWPEVPKLVPITLISINFYRFPHYFPDYINLNTP